jgi:hypothetical protein
MNEPKTRVELIDPKLKACGWGVVDFCIARQQTKRVYRICTEQIH